MKYLILTSTILLTACSHMQDTNKTVSSFVDNQTLALRVSSKLNKDKDIWKNSHISILNYKKNILLLGQTKTLSLKNKIEEVAGKISSIEKVYNQIEVKEPSSFTQRMKDTWLTAQVKAKLFAEPKLSSTTVKVITEENTVYLMGSPNPDTKEKAIEITRNIKGVAQVIDVFES